MLPIRRQHEPSQYYVKYEQVVIFANLQTKDERNVLNRNFGKKNSGKKMIVKNEWIDIDIAVAADVRTRLIAETSANNKFLLSTQQSALSTLHY